MPTRVRSYSKINLGLAIGRLRPDGFHGLTTLYQTLRLHDVVTVSAHVAQATRITLDSNDPRVPRDSRNTAWRMVEGALATAGVTAEVKLHIQKRLPIQGGMGAGSANAAAALVGLETELGLQLDAEQRIRIASEVGSDVPLFLVGGAVFGTDRGEVVAAAPELRLNGSDEIPCVVALPGVGVSTPQAFRDWDQRIGFAQGDRLHEDRVRGNMEKLSRTYARAFSSGEDGSASGASGILPDPCSASSDQNNPEKLQELSREQLHASLEKQGESGFRIDLAENTLLALVRTGIENDFETVVFPKHPSLREIKRQLMGFSDEEGSAVYAALSGSGSALFGLYRTDADARAAQQRVQQAGFQAIVTTTLPRRLYWSEMLASDSSRPSSSQEE